VAFAGILVILGAIVLGISCKESEENGDLWKSNVESLRTNGRESNGTLLKNWW
jgi:hypothetical protein